MKEITKDKAIAAMADKGLDTLIIKAGESPYSAFDLLAFPKGHIWRVAPSNWTLSEVRILSADPATAYKGRVGEGRLWLVRPEQGGLVAVTSSDDVKVVLADGTSIGIRKEVTFGDLFAGLQI